jgi:lipopolysaccharide cholinephosphotransferase
MVKLKLKIPDDFLEEETRSGYKISSEMKKVWAVELDLLSEMLRVCDKYNLKIYADGGTLLGAIRHSGFIPWDDDIDLCMFRDDYNKLCRIANDEFVFPYFFQTEYTDPGTTRGHAQLRNSETTGILKYDLDKATFNQGIFIDIFPIDAITDNRRAFKFQLIRAKRFINNARRAARFSRMDYNKNKLHGRFNGVIEKVVIPYVVNNNLELKYYKKFEAEVSKYDDQNTKEVATFAFTLKGSDSRHRSDFDGYEMHDFEFIQIPVMKGYDHVLTRLYGDYMTPTKNPSYHGETIFSTDISYIEFLKTHNTKIETDQKRQL